MLRRVITMLTALASFGFPACAREHNEPYVEFPIDVSKAGDQVAQPVTITAHRTYQFLLKFKYTGRDDMHSLLPLVGTGARRADGGHADPGVPVPIKLTVHRVGRDPAVFDEVVETEGHFAHGFDAIDQRNGDFKRMIAALALEPGAYTVRAVTLRDIPEFRGRPVFLGISFHPKVTPLKD